MASSVSVAAMAWGRGVRYGPYAIAKAKKRRGHEPWNTKYTGFLSSPPNFSEMNFCVLCKIWGSRRTLPGE